METSTLVIIIAVIAVVAVIVFMAKNRKGPDVNRPIQLTQKHGGGICNNPDFDRLRKAFRDRHIEDGLNPSQYVDYAFGKDGLENARTHYSRFGNDYPKDIFPCMGDVDSGKRPAKMSKAARKRMEIYVE